MAFPKEAGVYIGKDAGFMRIESVSSENLTAERRLGSSIRQEHENIGTLRRTRQ